MFNLREQSGKTEDSLFLRPIATPEHSWDTELFVLRGQDREDLGRRVQTLQDFLHRNSEINLKDLAYTLNANMAAGGNRLALVAGSAAELQLRLATAAQRLADPTRSQIKDAVGIYYFDRPLHPEGGLALLFPGEGAQYLNMLGDLYAHFPEIKQCFDDVDRLAAAQPSGRAFSPLFLVPDNASAEERAEAERRLRQVDNAVFSILLADWAMFQLLSQLGLKPAAVAGHSMGELAALWAAGCVDVHAMVLEQIAATLNILVSKESTAAAVVLAVAAGKSVVEKIIGEKVGSGVFIGMDNCPHQSVLIGPPHLITLVEAELPARRILCERLPFERPFHTPLFEPFLGTLHELFAEIEFHAATIPIYSGSTGRPFPPQPAQIRREAVCNYAAPVAFTRVIENMHGDGVRLFVECGPRGNLTSFVEDILRGQSFAALASNLPRRSGLTQLNHLAGQLAAHHVQFNLSHLYCRRDPRQVYWERTSSTVVSGTTHNGHDAMAHERVSEVGGLLSTPVLPLIVTSQRSEVFAQYLNVMDQFLDDQLEAMQGYFARRRGSVGLDHTLGVPSVEVKDRAVAEPRVGHSFSDLNLGLLRSAALVRLEVGKEAVVRRPLVLSEDLFASHHTVGGQVVSKVDPGQRGLPVMPMTFSLEMMAEVASLLAPGLSVVGLKDIRLWRWLAFEDKEPATIEIKASAMSDAALEPGIISQVAVEIRDLGSPANTVGSRGPAAQGIVLLAEHYPAPPPVGEFALTNEHPSPIPVEVLYKNLFHGPLFQGVQPGARSGEEGVESEVIVLPRDQLLYSDPDPRFLADPVLLDMSMHPLNGWHLEFPDQSGRILLPIELERLELFGPRPEVGARFVSRASILATSYRSFVHSVDLIAPKGSMWARLHRIKFWRFYVPFAKVNFHGPKDEYFISKEWNSSLPQSSVPACCVRLDMPADQKQPAMRLVTAKVTLSPAEMMQYYGVQGNEQAEIEWLFGRLAGKDAARMLWYSQHGERLFPADINVESNADGRLVALRRGHAGQKPFATISVAHTEHVIAGLAATAPHAGIDLQLVQPRDAAFEGFAFNEEERDLLDHVGPDRDEWITRFWCGKRAVIKALGQAGTDGPKSVAVRDADQRTGVVKVALGAALAEIFPQCRFANLLASTSRDGNLVVAVSLCERERP
jgi:malonyl CoA-acyl carrier protein transacylase/phosphopantetheinyl transferase (holo-ACP synthase)